MRFRVHGSGFRVRVKGLGFMRFLADQPRVYGLVYKRLERILRKTDGVQDE
jgi:hypothetical protein